MNNKRLFLFAFAVLCMTVYSPCCAAIEPTTITGDSLSVSNGNQIIEYSVAILNNTGLCGYDVSLKYDTDVFCLVDLDSGTNCSCGTFSESGNIVCTPTKDGCRVVWSNLTNVLSDGTLFTVFLKAETSAALGDYTVEVSYTAKNTIDSDNTQVPLITENGKITLRESQPTIVGETLSVVQGDRFEYSVSIVDNPGIAGYRITIQYDTDCFEPDMSGEFVNVVSADAYKSGTMYASKTSTGCQILWFASENVQSIGTLFTIGFTVSKSATVKDYTFTVGYEEDDTLDENGNAISFSTQSGIIHCSKKEYSIDVNTNLIGQTISFDVATMELPEVGTGLVNVIAAVYEYGSGELLGITVRSISCAELVQNGVTVPISSPSIHSSVSWKVFVLNGQFAPLCTAKCGVAL